MKTTTYLRLSLLIPFLVWAFCALTLFLLSTFEPDELGSDGPTAFAVMAIFFLYRFCNGSNSFMTTQFPARCR
jgi:hypothetical protein